MGRATVVGDRLFTPCSGSGIYIHHRQTAVSGPLAVPLTASHRLRTAPNPFNPSTTISYSIPVADHVRIQVIDLRGRLVATLVNTAVEAGWHDVSWNGRDDAGYDVPSGVYISRLEANGRVSHGRMTLVR
jgi:hypothetical protein